MTKVVIVGAGVAGVNAATKLVDNGFDGKITIIDMGLDPYRRPAADVIVPRKKTKTNENSNLLSYISKTNRLIIFPSWLLHWVPINESNRNRISISFNIQIKGQVGEHHEYQSGQF